jgi:hypothetical protein
MVWRVKAKIVFFKFGRILVLTHCAKFFICFKLRNLTSDQRWGVMLEFEEVCPEGFAQLVARLVGVDGLISSFLLLPKHKYSASPLV